MVPAYRDCHHLSALRQHAHKLSNAGSRFLVSGIEWMEFHIADH